MQLQFSVSMVIPKLPYSSLSQACIMANIHVCGLKCVCVVTPQAKSTGQLSLLTALMSTAGCLARIFTSIQEGAGLSMVRGFCLGKDLTPFCHKQFGATFNEQVTAHESTTSPRCNCMQYANRCKKCCFRLPLPQELSSAGGVLNTTVLCQILWYSKNTQAQARQARKKKE